MSHLSKPPYVSLVVCQVSAGFPSPADDYLETPLCLNELLIDDPPATFFVKVSGCSMEKIGIFEQDLAVVNRSKKPQAGHIVIAVKNNEFLIKELQIKNQQLWLKAHQDNIPLQTLDEDQGDQIWGVVTGIVRHLQ